MAYVQGAFFHQECHPYLSSCSADARNKCWRRKVNPDTKAREREKEKKNGDAQKGDAQEGGSSRSGEPHMHLEEEESFKVYIDVFRQRLCGDCYMKLGVERFDLPPIAMEAEEAQVKKRQSLKEAHARHGIKRKANKLVEDAEALGIHV
jgi:hypothetical protein